MSRKPSLTDGLPEEMPDLDTLIDADAEFDSSAAGFTKAKRVQSARIVTFDARKVKAACDALQVMPTEGESVHIVVSQSFAGFDLIPAFLKLTGAASYQKLYLTTLGFSRDNLAQIEVMIRAGQIPPPETAHPVRRLLPPGGLRPLGNRRTTRQGARIHLQELQESHEADSGRDRGQVLRRGVFRESALLPKRGAFHRHTEQDAFPVSCGLD